KGKSREEANRSSGVAGAAGKVTEKIKKHPVATAATAAAAGVGLMLVEGVRRALTSSNASDQDRDDDDRGDVDDKEDDAQEDESDDEEDEGTSAKRDDDESADEDEEEDEADDDEEDDVDADDSDDQSDDEEEEDEEEEDDEDQADEGEQDEEDEEEDDDAAEASHRGSRDWGNLYNHPLVICATAAAVGAAAAYFLPSTDLENRMMGKSADRVNRRLRKATRGLFGEGENVFSRAISEVTSAAAREAEREGLTPDRLGRKVKRIVSHVRQAVTDAVDED
ncbi:MAG: hypothetical protein QOE14_1111, partial [Humisphaera sp.]|nr:hypothetical protein [Humisphaera sp.]